MNRKCLFLISIVFWLLSGVFISNAQAEGSLAKEPLNGQQLIEYLNQEKQHLNTSISAIKAIKSLQQQNLKDIEKLHAQNKALAALNKLKTANLESFLFTQDKLQESFIRQLKQLQKSTLTDWGSLKAQQKFSKINTLHKINKDTIALLHETIKRAKHYQKLLQQQDEQITLSIERLKLRDNLQRSRTKDVLLASNLNKLYEKSIQLQQKITGHQEGFSPGYHLEAALLLNNQLINLTQHKRAELKIQRQLAKADFSLLKNPDIRTLQFVTEEYKNSISKLSDLEQSLKNIAALLTSEKAFLTGKMRENYQSVLTILNQRVENLIIQEQTLQEDLENHQTELKKQLSSRTTLAEYHIDSWPAFVNQLTAIPGQSSRYFKNLILKSAENYQALEFPVTLMMWFCVCAIVFSVFAAHSYLHKMRIEKQRSRLSGHLYEGLLTLLSRNLPHLALLGCLQVVMYFNHIMFSNYQLLVNLILLWISFRAMILVARLSLLERMSDYSGSDVQLYHRLKWLLLTGGWTTGLMMFSQLLPLDSFLQDMFSRLFMLFLAAVSIVLWRSREVILYLLSPLLKNKKRYIRTAVMVLVILLPLTLFSTAIIGLSGYINLAWTMSSYQFLLIMMLCAYVLLRGMIVDALDLFSEWMISSLKNGWLWVEVWLKPLDKMLRLALIVCSIYILFKLFGWQSDSWVITELNWMMRYPLIDISGIHITAASVIDFVILLYIFSWAAKWIREFGYRWLYRNTRDSGIRNSLSVFTQYAVILIGAVVTLRALGLDFSGMSMVIGGLAVGMGFGLRDFASNVVGGLMVLIERTVREGDIITLGEYEGRVSHIGIRTMRISSWDNMEVLVPNAETFSKPFTNWTHQDNIVRTVLPIKVSRSDDPLMVQQIILDVLALIPEIANDPPCQVLLKQIDEALISFEIRYYINIQLHNRFEMRSKVLFAIMAQFKASGIKAPVPPIRLEMQEQESEAIHLPKPTGN